MHIERFGLIAAFVPLVARPQGEPACARPGGCCGTTLTADEAEATLWMHERGTYGLAFDPLYTLHVPMTIHIVTMDNGFGGYAANDIPLDVQDVNAAFADAGMSFFHAGAVDFIGSNQFYFATNTQARIDQLRQTNVVANTINVYFVPNLSNESGALCGISSFTTSAVQGIVIRNSCAAGGGEHSTLAHEIGHYFDLYHTHETQFGSECPDGSNCSTAGDLVCDTPADPNLASGVDAACRYTGNAQMCGQNVHPDTSNFMSYALPWCRTRFSDAQSDRALATLINLRPNLIGAPGLAVTWVDFAYSGSESGSYSHPFNLLSEGIGATANGGRVVLKRGSSLQTLHVDTGVREVILDAFRGSARIGG